MSDEAEYRGQIPEKIKDLDPAWKSCLVNTVGLYDPPGTLRVGPSAATPTLEAPQAPTTLAPSPAAPVDPAWPPVTAMPQVSPSPFHPSWKDTSANSGRTASNDPNGLQLSLASSTMSNEPNPSFSAITTVANNNGLDPPNGLGTPADSGPVGSVSSAIVSDPNEGSSIFRPGPDEDAGGRSDGQQTAADSNRVSSQSLVSQAPEPGIMSFSFMDPASQQQGRPQSEVPFTRLASDPSGFQANSVGSLFRQESSPDSQRSSTGGPATSPEFIYGGVMSNVAGTFSPVIPTSFPPNSVSTVGGKLGDPQGVPIPDSGVTNSGNSGENVPLADVPSTIAQAVISASAGASPITMMQIAAPLGSANTDRRVVIGQSTLTRGGNAVTLANDQAVSLDSAGVVLGGVETIPLVTGMVPEATSGALVTLDASQALIASQRFVTATNGGISREVMVGGTTLDAETTRATIGGHVISVVSNGRRLAFDGSTADLPRTITPKPSPQQSEGAVAEAVIPVGSLSSSSLTLLQIPASAGSADSGYDLAIDGKTLSPGEPPVTIGTGDIVSLGSAGVVVRASQGPNRTIAWLGSSNPFTTSKTSSESLTPSIGNSTVQVNGNSSPVYVASSTASLARIGSTDPASTTKKSRSAAMKAQTNKLALPCSLMVATFLAINHRSCV